MATHATRQNHLAAMHIAQKALGLSADDAAALKLAVTGKSSAADMSEAQRRKYLAHLSSLQARMGGTATQDRPPRPARQRAVADGQDERWGKAQLLWTALAQAGHINADTDAALLAYVKRQTGVDAWRFLNSQQINTVIEAIKRWCLRVGVSVHAC